MPDAPDPNAPDPNAPPPNTPDPIGTSQTPEQLQAEVDKWKALSRKNEGEAKTNRDAAAKLATLEESQKTEAQKLEDRAKTAETALASATLNSTRLHVALTKGLPPELAVRLQGSTEAEMEADADSLLALVKGAGGGSVDMGQGARGNGAPPDDMNARLRAAAGRTA